MKKLNLSMIAFTMLSASTFVMAGGDIKEVEPVVEPIIEVVQDDWSGPYIGLQAGYVMGDASTIAGDEGEFYDWAALDGFDVNGFGGGVFAGYLWKLDNDFVVGIEGEYNIVSADDSVVGGDGWYGATVEHDWDASLRLRIGKVMGDYLPYITGGVAWAGITTDGWVEWGGTDYNEATLVGWTAGLGVERKINKNLNARIQYRYSDYGDETWTLEQPNDMTEGKVEYTAHMLTIGVSYRF